MPNTFINNRTNKKSNNKKNKSQKKGRVKKQRTKKQSNSKALKSIKIVFGVILMLFALYTTASMISYLINLFKSPNNFKVSIINPTWDFLINGDSNNFMGNFGEILADLFIKQWFGVGAFLFMFLLFHFGFKLTFNRKIIKKQFIITPIIFLILWLGIALSIVLKTHPYNILAGNIGIYCYSKLYPIFQAVGTSVLLIVLLLTFFAIRYKLNILKVVKSDEEIEEEKAKKKKESKNEDTIDVTSEETFSDSTIEVIPNINDSDKIISESSENDNDEIKLVDNKDNEIGEKRGNITFFDLGKRKSKKAKLKEGKDDTDTIIDDSDTIINEGITENNEENIVFFESEIKSDLDNNAVEDDVRNNTNSLGTKTFYSSQNDGVSNKDDTFAVERPTEESLDEKAIKDHQTLETEYDPTLDLPHYQMPSIELLNHYELKNVEISDEEILKNRQKITNTLKTYEIEIQSITATVGPTVTLYEIVPAPGIRIAKIKNLEDDIAMSLAAIGIRIIAPIPGKGTIGIEVPNEKPQIVSLKSVLSSRKFVESKFELPIALGKTITNESFVTDLTKMPHLLVAGATGQGKSVGLNAIIASLLYKKHPSQLKFVLIDPKKVEFSLYEKIEKHYLAKIPNIEETIITDTSLVVSTLNSLIVEMNNRYNLLKMSGQRNIKQYNSKFIARQLNPNKGHKYLPYIVVVIDEFADLIMTAGKEVERPLTRLAQLARATGIHLVIATQRPSVNIITGTIKANFPARLAFRVVQKTDSRTILDCKGAEQLIGRGDMLFSTGNIDLIRMQCAFIDTDEVMRLTEFIQNQRGYKTAFELPEYKDESTENFSANNPEDRDELFNDAALLIVQTQNGSTSSLQRRFNIGYNRAGRIMDQIEAAGIVGPQQGSKPREVYIATEVELDKILSDK
ncbi:MAG: DNA translocase FtsK 4TM domain-containing protein [Bacteroidales bacterium]|jgi:S-DNA-T family DNA segregation ATPase FtsK/SpoIIIE